LTTASLALGGEVVAAEFLLGTSQFRFSAGQSLLGTSQLEPQTAAM
jgi:hypothetical protein